MSWPAWDRIAEDAEMVAHPTAIAVLALIRQRLDFTVFERLRVSDIARELHYHRNTVSDAMGLLLARGYIERGPRSLDLFTYRLRYNRRQTEKHPKGAPT